MNSVSKLYEVYINRELQESPQSLLNVERINQKILSFLHDLSEVSSLSGCYAFWDQNIEIDHQALLNQYIDGLTMLMSIGYDLRIDSIKNHSELSQPTTLYDAFFKVYHDILEVQSTYSSKTYQDTIDDYFNLAFHLGIQVEEILHSYEK